MCKSIRKTYSPIFKKGFTILETLVAISILVLALTAPMVIVSQALKSSYFSRDQITAYYLAQEAIEYLRNTRDNQGLVANQNADQWMNNLFTDSNGTPLINNYGSSNIKAYLVRNSLGYELKQCTGVGSPSPCPNVSYNADAFDPSSNAILYGDENATDSSIFIREITISKPPAGVINPGNTTGVSEVNDPSLREVIVTVKVIWKMEDGTYSSGVTLNEYLTNWQLEKQ
jgi:prepilin-type N-terminal cleavage/methylation domain-containing protein